MPARDLYHNAVINALLADGWKITHDPFYLAYGGREVYIDLGAEKVTIAAEKESEKIVVEIKSFLRPSPVTDLQEAVGVYEIYRSLLKELQPERRLYLAIAKRAYEGIFTERFGQLILENLNLKLIVFDEKEQRILTWIN
ncbi:XisH family protein [Scytonema hofmannii FACHB-248]|uniref:XisH family protein n=1 Tax=Scytonema hofmannii FACHB-248 TaxID=1842502 RepID=A0ABR8GZV7_9CYAN|nr:MULTISPECIES: element excision factor XisH family protein [Nostocales]MBD2608541.1 XisH family protein [Scytonema hofmannii FACHB-248]